MTEQLSYRDALRAATARLTRAGKASAALDARLLLCRAADLTHEALIARSPEPMPPPAAQAFDHLLERRLRGEPVARILGEKEFWGLPFQLSPETLVPRPDSEAIVEAALAAFPDREAPLRVLDLGTGSGCLLLAVLSERPGAQGIGLDRSHAAVSTARRNAEALGLNDRARFVVGNWVDGVAGRFDLVLANPPYIRSDDVPALADEVKVFDPLRALDGGPDGLTPYREIVPHLFALLDDGGRAVLETAPDLYADLFEMAQKTPGLLRVEKVVDLAGRARGLSIGKANFSGEIKGKKGVGIAPRKG